MLVQSVQQLHLGPGELVQAGDDFSHEAVFDGHEVLLGDQHVGANFVGARDDPTLVGTGVFEDQDAFLAQLFPSFGRQEEVGTFDDQSAAWDSGWGEEVVPVAFVHGRRSTSARDKGVSHQAVVKRVPQDWAIGIIERHDSTFAGQLALVKLGDWQFGFKQAKKFLQIQSLRIFATP